MSSWSVSFAFLALILRRDVNALGAGIADHHRANTQRYHIAAPAFEAQRAPPGGVRFDGYGGGGHG
jgi:hypothetical protein